MIGSRFLAAIFAVAGALAIGAGEVAAAESPDGVWREVREVEIPRSPRAREIIPQRYRAFELNRGPLVQLLAQAPPERSRRPSESDTVLQLPMPDGSYQTFRIVESPVMEAELAAKYPEIRTWLGQGVEDPTATVRFDLTPHGFHAQVIASDGTVYVDPYQPGDVDHYIAYHKRDHVDGRRVICAVTGESVDEKSHALMHAKLSSGGMLRTYRLAVAATGEYTQYHGGTVVDGLAAIVSTMNRVNGLYEREVSVRMVLVANNDLIIYTNPASDPYANTSGDLNANQSNITSIIGAANYDIGHLVGTGGGGVAGLGVVCNATNKARGLTGSGAPITDGFAVDYVAHEMGHQFNGNHTFNGSGINCAAPNRSAAAAYEPGSGITIQAYAGICGLDNLQPNSEDYFHRVSLNEIIAYTSTGTGGTCGATSLTGNAVPTVTTTTSFAIPSGTPFALTATGADTNGDVLTYLWEQFNLGTAPNTEGALNPAATNGPLFRSFVPTTSPTRVFPSLRYILNNANIVPASAPLPGTTSPSFFTGEALPTAARTLDFRVTVRDNRAGGGGTNEATTQLTVVVLATPFAVTAPNTAVSLASGAATTVTWNFLGTQLSPINATNVRISLSTDGGFTFPHVLAATTANDGTESVTVPAGLATAQARIRVEAIGNVFFDISDANFTITSGNTPPTINVTGSVTTRQGSPTASAVVATISDAQDPASSLSVSVSGAPSELSVAVQNVGGNVTLSATADCDLVAPTSGNKVYPLVLSVTDSAGGVRSAEINVNVGANRTPTLGAYTSLNAVAGQTRLVTPDPLAADANANLSAASVTPTTLPGGGTVSIGATGVVTVAIGATTPLGTYPIRPVVTDTCGAAESRQFSVVVGNPQISLAVGATRVSTGNGLLEPNECNDVFVSVRNDGNIPATGVSAVISTTTPNIAITQSTSAYSDIMPGEARDNSLAFKVSSTNALTCFSNVNLSLSVTYSGGAGSPFAGAASVPVGRALAQNYTFTSSTGTLPTTGQMTLVAGSQQDDGLVDLVVPAGFGFSIYDTAVAGGTTLRASSNGNLQFRNSQGATDAGNSTLPAAGIGNGQAVFPPTGATLFLQWDDWRLDAGDPVNVAADAGIYTRLEGTAPNRTWYVEWRGRVRGDGAVATNNNRAAIVFHEGSDSFDYVYGLTGVGAAANAAGATIGVQAAATGTRFTQFAFNDANLAPGTKLTASRLPAICAAGSGGCVVATPGVAVTQSGGTTNVAEGGATDTYTIALTSQPTGTVTITVTPDAQLTTSGNLTFTTGNWNVAQTVTVTAVDDNAAEGDHAGSITHAAAGGGYDGVAVPGVAVSISDNDVDLAVSNVLTNAPVLAGKRMAWEVAVENLTLGVNVASAQFAFTLSPVLANVTWICVGDAGAVCPANGTGAPNHAIALNGGTGVSYAISADVPVGTAVGTLIDSLATISVVSPSDPVPANNQAATSHTVGTESIFSNGFEDPIAVARQRLGLD